MSSPDPFGWHDAGYRVDAMWDRFRGASDPVERAHALTELNDAIHDLITWLPRYDANLGCIPAEEE